MSKLGALSRTEARSAIAAGRVQVDGVRVRDPDRWIVADACELRLDGVPVVRTERLYLAMHKPVGVVTTRRDERGRRTVCDLLPAGLPLVGPVGRLDLNSSGLLLFTNDTQLGHAISGPGGRLAKVYEVRFDRPLDATVVARWREGAVLDGERLRPVEVACADPRDPCAATLTLREGRNRQIRRMAQACGREVLRLHRVAIGPIHLGELAESAVRPLGADELAALRAALPPR